MKSILEDSHTFVIRLWLEPRDIKGAEPVWRGRIDHVENGSRIYVKSVDEIKAFLTSYLETIQVASGAKRDKTLQ